jgi:hypothetical protein
VVERAREDSTRGEHSARNWRRQTGRRRSRWEAGGVTGRPAATGFRDGDQMRPGDGRSRASSSLGLAGGASFGAIEQGRHGRRGEETSIGFGRAKEASRARVGLRPGLIFFLRW